MIALVCGGASTSRLISAFSVVTRPPSPLSNPFPDRPRPCHLYMDWRASQRKQYQRLSASHTSPNVPAEEEPLVRRRVRSTNSDRSAAYSRAQFVAGSSRPRPSGKRITNHTVHGSQKVNGGTASLGSSPLSRQSVLDDEEGDEGMLLSYLTISYLLAGS